jgi:predicted peroxiredoxin
MGSRSLEEIIQASLLSHRTSGHFLAKGRSARRVNDERFFGVSSLSPRHISVGGRHQGAAAQSTPATAATPAKQPILVNITRGRSELHAVSMALGLAQAAIKDSRSATVFLNVKAPVFTAKDLDDDLRYEGFPPVKKMPADFVASGGRVLVYAHCAHVVKLQPADMMPAAKVVSQDEFFAALTPGTVVFSY